MFNRGNTKSEGKSILPTSNINIIGAGTSIKGDIVCEGDIRIDGSVEGLVSTKSKVVVGPEGSVSGDIQCDSADILGQVTGIIKVDDLLFLKGNAVVKGDVYTKHFEMEPSANFNGRCHMEASEGKPENKHGRAKREQAQEEQPAETIA
ncbi:cell shape determination protein CcmA [Chitinophaga caeni]|uniref:Cell shape determination protein CcmA n=1 Tax=Chitinophaga caeni TaxID=2029983 RepID=A0A291R0D1_9BACT|nr:polymer-forming cytoskeletal protein [Chitinophaga caeni]ATL49621.1 cell shape determination protein CcmA [Chitinophaga caeni]